MSDLVNSRQEKDSFGLGFDVYTCFAECLMLKLFGSYYVRVCTCKVLFLLSHTFFLATCLRLSLGILVRMRNTYYSTSTLVAVRYSDES